MQITRYVARVAAAGALAVLLAAGTVVGVAGAAETTSTERAGGPTNRGWTAPAGAADEFAERSK